MSSIDLFRGVPTALVEPYLARCERRTIGAGEILLDPGRHNDCVYFVLAGVLTVHLAGAEERAVARVEPGGCVGEISVVDRKPPSAYVVAAEDSQLLVMSEQVLWHLVEASSEVARNLLYLVCSRLRNQSLAMVGIERQASRDPLTGVLNRRGFERVFNRLREEHAQAGQPVCLVLLDVDHFKSVNDRYGHVVSDGVLRGMVRTIEEHARASDSLARLGGDEFALLLARTPLERGLETAERIRRRVSEAALATDGPREGPAVTISLGVAMLAPEDSLESLLARADEALYRAKRDGRNRVCT
jgi:diguanylate cyclase (GGDEF)-like protein